MKRNKPLERRTPLPRISAKRRLQEAAYRTLRRDFLAHHSHCEFPLGCTRVATDVHHRRGRVGRLLIDRRFWSALCRQHHMWVTVNPAQAYALGISENRIGGAA